MHDNLPIITGSTYASNTIDMNAMLANPNGVVFQAGIMDDRFLREVVRGRQNGQIIEAHKGAKMSTARIVKVYIADPNENLPLASRVLHSSEEKLTDLTDQELFFEVPIAELLAKHNELRATTRDKSQSEKFGRDIFLEPVRIRDLRMVVVAIAQF